MRIQHILIAIIITCIWGLNFSVIKLGLQNIDPFILAGFRFLLCAFPAIFFVKKPDVSLKIIALYGILFGVGLWGIVNLGVFLGVSAGVASLILQFSSFISIIMGYFLLKENVIIQQIIGILLGLLGLALIIIETNGSVSIIGVILILVAAIIWSITNLIIKKSGTKEVFSFLVWSCLFSPIPLFLIGYLTSSLTPFDTLYKNFDYLSIFSILFQAYPTTLIGYWVWNNLLKTYPISTVAPLTLLVPVFGFAGSFIIFEETINILKMFACFLILLGLVIGLYGKNVSTLIGFVTQRFKRQRSPN